MDYNRGGVPLIEIVSEPDIRSIDEAKEYLEKIQLIMKYIGVSDCKMQEGSLRCDVNISLRPVGSEKFGTRCEIKNMNSFTYMERAMKYEFERQADLLDSGEEVIQETRRYDVESGCTESMRGKEDAQDYRYFREPDLVAIFTPAEKVEALRGQLPELPDSRMKRYTEMGIAPADASLLVKYQAVAQYFDAAADGVKNPKNVSNFMVGQMFRRGKGAVRHCFRRSSGESKRPGQAAGRGENPHESGKNGAGDHDGHREGPVGADIRRGYGGGRAGRPAGDMPEGDR